MRVYEIYFRDKRVTDYKMFVNAHMRKGRNGEKDKKFIPYLFEFLNAAGNEVTQMLR